MADVSTYKRLSSNTNSTNNTLSVMLWDAGDGMFIEGGIEAAGFAASLRGDGFFVFQNDEDNAFTSDHIADFYPINDTDSNSYRTLLANEVAVITRAYLQLETLSDTIKIEYGYGEGVTPDVSSDFVQLGVHIEAFSGAAPTATNNLLEINFCPPLSVAQSATAGCIGFRVNVNDAAVEASFGMQGFVMKNLDQITV
jgi:hypothetical protein